MGIKQFTMSAMSRVGYYLTKTPPFSRQLKVFLDSQDIDIVLDVGAHHGGYCSFLRNHVGYQGNIVSFEPCASSFKELNRQMAHDKRWRGFNFGLSDKDATSKLNTYGPRGNFNSVLSLKDIGRSSCGVTDPEKSETIELRKLDSVWDSAVGAGKVFLKMDTQGHDLAAAKGAENHLNLIHGLQSELPSISIYDAMPSMADALSAYRQMGFAPVGFFPVTIVAGYNSPLEFDVLFRRPLEE